MSSKTKTFNNIYTIKASGRSRVFEDDELSFQEKMIEQMLEVLVRVFASRYKTAKIELIKKKK